MHGAELHDMVWVGGKWHREWTGQNGTSFKSKGPEGRQNNIDFQGRCVYADSLGLSKTRVLESPLSDL